MKKTLLNTIQFLTYILGSMSIFLLIQTIAIIFIDSMTPLNFIARVGVVFLTLLLCVKTLLEIDKKQY